MTLESQVCSLPLAKRLKELGVKQKSVFVWYTNAQSSYLLYIGPDGMRPMEQKTYSAFTVAELGEMLPLNNIYPSIGKSDEAPFWFVNFTRHLQDSYDTEAEARAQTLIHLLEQGIIKAEDL